MFRDETKIENKVLILQVKKIFIFNFIQDIGAFTGNCWYYYGQTYSYSGPGDATWKKRVLRMRLRLLCGG
jgi:hypothetical protein